MINTSLPPDIAARRQALDVGQSFVVQAPAGSGKTELLIQRILSLLAIVERPEEVLAITFTRKAAGEMRERLLKALERAEDVAVPAEEHERTTWERARKVLARDAAKGWSLRANPSRLQIMTIDSFCSGLSRKMPWLTRLGEQPGISDDPHKLYRQAAENFLAGINSKNSGQEPIVRLLRHLDNRLDLLRDLLVGMLGRRDQWLRHVISRTTERRAALEGSLASYIESELKRVYLDIGGELWSEACALATYAAQQLAAAETTSPLAPFHDEQEFDPLSSEYLDKWFGVCHLLLTSTGALRKSVNKNLGFPAEKTGDAPLWKKRMLSLLERFDQLDLAEGLARLRKLPHARYDNNQWQILEALIELLPLVVVELRAVFRHTGTVDFTEVAGAALAGLGTVETPGDLLLRIDNSLSHILVDEFQDTSYAQYELLRKLTAGWEEGDGRTLFVVGDPMQSIYLFREADVGLFLKVCQQGLGGIGLTPLTLTANFRSQKSLVDWFNRTFRGLFPQVESSLTGAVRYAEADAVRAGNGESVVTTVFSERQDIEEAEAVLSLIKETGSRTEDGSCAVLVRSRAHLNEIVKTLKANGIRYHAQDVDPLSSRPVIFDLVALTRALLFPCDRIAWLAVLRAPWCGLALADLLQLADHDKNVSVLQALADIPVQQEMFSVLSPDARSRLDRVVPILAAARQRRGRVTLAHLVESTWLQLGGGDCISGQDIDDAQQFFNVLRSVEAGGDLPSLQELTSRLADLFAAPDPNPETGLQIMTIHKAKGLEFDTVILPGLGRGIRRRDKQLLQWLEQPDLDLLLAPIPSVDGGDDATYRAIGSILQQREDNETLRLLYVAATRARERLYLLGHVREGTEGPSAATGSLLHAAWPALAQETRPVLPAAEASEVTAAGQPSIRRLPAEFSVALPEPLIADRQMSAVRASDAGDVRSVDPRSFTLRSQEGRIIGTVVHAWLERFARDGVDFWKNMDQHALVLRIKDQLSSQGIPESRISACSDKVMQCINNVFSSEKALWIVGARTEGECELSLSGMIDEKLVHASIDRTFIDGKTRWVVDYKTTQPEEGCDIESFLGREAEKYRPQLQVYMDLITALDPQHEVRGALYFPMIDSWREIEV